MLSDRKKTYHCVLLCYSTSPQQQTYVVQTTKADGGYITTPLCPLGGFATASERKKKILDAKHCLTRQEQTDLLMAPFHVPQ